MAPSSIRIQVTGGPTAALGVRQAVVRAPTLAQPLTPGNARIPLISRHFRPEDTRLASGRPSATRQTSALFAFRSRTALAALASEELTDQDLRVLWDTIPKPLITIGKKGIEPSHCNSLKDLLGAHKVVKVKLISNNVGAEEAEALRSGSEGVFLQQKGSTMMFAKGGLEKEDLMAVGASNSKRKESRAAHRSDRREKRREEPPELDPILTTALQRLVRKGKLQVGDVDNMAAWAMVDLPNDEARHAAAKKMTPQAISKVVNKSAWITSICKQAVREHGDSS